ncbi:hypothetical protein JCM14469_28540 [Desulfatiferula olefinivorans]
MTTHRRPGVFRALFFRTAAALAMLTVAVSVLRPCPAACNPADRPAIHVNVGYVIDSFTGVSIEDAKIAIRLIFESRFKEKYPEHKGNVTLYPDIDSAILAIRAGRIQGLGVTTLDYLTTRHENRLIPVRAATLGDSAITRFVLLTRKDRFTSLDDLRDTAMLLETAGHGKVSAMWLDTLLLERSLPGGRDFFASLSTVKKESQAILKVFFGKADACVVQASTFAVMTELNPQIGARLTTLIESPDFLIGLFAIVDGIDAATRELMLALIDGLPGDPEGRKILSMFRVNGVSPYRAESIATIEALYRSHRTLSGHGE